MTARFHRSTHSSQFHHNPCGQAPFISRAPSTLALTLHERRQRKGVAGVLAPEDGEQRAVHDEEHAAPGDEGDALGPGVADPGDFDGQGNSGQSEDTICVF